MPNHNNKINQCASVLFAGKRLAGKAAALLAFCLLAWFSPTTAEAGSTIHNVRVNGDIQAAIDVASNGDTIQLAAGQYDITTTIDPGGKQVTILGTVDGNGAPTSVLDGGNPVGGTSGVRVLICQNGETSTTVFENLVIQNGVAAAGGGMSNNGSNPTLTNCTFRGNSAKVGGGMYNTNSSSPTLANCNFCGNVDGSGFNSISGDAINGSSSGNNLLDAACVFGDINGDGVFNYADRAAMNIALGVCDADINGDGEVNGADMAFILSWWGPCIP